VEDILYNKKLIDGIIKENLDIFKYEYRDNGIREKTWRDYKTKEKCSCKKKIFAFFMEDSDKFNAIMSKLMGKDVNIIFPEPIKEPIVKEFDNIVDMESFLISLKEDGKVFRNLNPSPNGKGGYILIVT